MPTVDDFILPWTYERSRECVKWEFDLKCVRRGVDLECVKVDLTLGIMYLDPLTNVSHNSRN